MTRKSQLHPVSRHGVVWLQWKLVIFLYVALSLLSLLCIHLQYYSVTMLETLSVAGSHIPPRKYPGDRPKVAFLFLTRRDLPLDFMWDRFFKGAVHSNFSVYIHSQPGFVFNEETTRSHYFYNRQLNNSINVIWGEYSMIEAERLLLSTAIDDHSNQRFVLLSDSCAPLYDFGYIYQYLISSPRSFVDRSKKRARVEHWSQTSCLVLLSSSVFFSHGLVSAQKQTLKNVTDYMVDVICKRAELGYNYGVILIPEGLIDFIPEVQELIAELNEILANEVVDENGLWKKKLFDLLPEAV
ncbi:hypothetical protein F2Q68_00042500 [Brassica cretica]|uniref:Core-2/I-branching beta-1,6-N-acetylglucosaminyltransferase family protein n=1 Tax=Brassica cretica TaxID=69181 RepID=A0A8S9MLD5_BRACR|nr:hypothetical protein F2Q68_00042500 [Brassica cretica]